MKVIDMKDYNQSMGVLISLEDKEDFIPIKNSINMKLSTIIDNPSKYLNKNETYYFYCTRGSRSRRAVEILSAYGYNVVKVTK